MAQIKKINWQSNHPTNCSLWSGDLLFNISYSIEPIDDKRWGVYRTQSLSEYNDYTPRWIVPTLEQAKELAQADFESEIKNWIVNDERIEWQDTWHISNYAGELRWEHLNRGSDIVAYKLA